MVMVLKASGLWEESRCDPSWTSLGLPHAVKNQGSWSSLPKGSSSSPRCERPMSAFQSWAQRGTLLGRVLRTRPGLGSVRAAGSREGSGTGVTRDGLQPHVSWDRALGDSPDPAVLRMVLKCTGMLISTAGLCGMRGGWAAHKCHAPQAKWVVPAQQQDPGQSDQRKDKQPRGQPHRAFVQQQVYWTPVLGPGSEPNRSLEPQELPASMEHPSIKF